MSTDNRSGKPEAIPSVASHDLLASVKLERHKCINDVCCFCAGQCPQYETKAEGPNCAGNYTHSHKLKETTNARWSVVLCKASAIFARARFEAGMRKQANDRDQRPP